MSWGLEQGWVASLPGEFWGLDFQKGCGWGKAGGHAQTSPASSFSLTLCLYVHLFSCHQDLLNQTATLDHNRRPSPTTVTTLSPSVLCGLSTVDPQQQLVQCHIFKVTHLLLER